MSALPVAAGSELGAYGRRVVADHPVELGLVVGLQVLAAVCGLFAPWLLGNLVADVTHDHDTVLRMALLICLALAAQAVLVRVAAYTAAKLGEKVLAGLREAFVSDVLALPSEVVEDAGAGDLITRTTRDVDLMSNTVRAAIPSTLTSVTVIVFTLVALVLTSPLLVLPCLIAVPALFGAVRWYLRRAHEGYLREAASYSRLTEGLAETVEGTRTIEALRLTARRMDQVNEDTAASYATERYTLRLRNIFLPICDTGYALPVAAEIIIGGLLYLHGVASLAAVTAAVLYASELLSPVDQLMYWLNELQTAGAALARLLGLSRFREPATALTVRPVPAAADGRGTEVRRDIVVRDLRYAYQPDRDVLRGIDLTIGEGEWLAVVGPSGAGKSTLAKLLAGLYEPGTGGITIGGQPVHTLTPAQRRGMVALVTQEHHVFRGTLRDNLAIARPDAGDEEISAALATVDAGDWAGTLGLDSAIGPGGQTLIRLKCSSWRWPGLSSPTRTRSSWTRRPRC